jgi:hypothetical protein
MDQPTLNSMSYQLDPTDSLVARSMALYEQNFLPHESRHLIAVSRRLLNRAWEISKSRNVLVRRDHGFTGSTETAGERGAL